MLAHPYEKLRERALRSPRTPMAYMTKLGGKDFGEFRPLLTAEVFARVNAYGHFLRTLSLKRGDRIALWAPNSIEWIAMDLAALAAGYVSVPLYLHSHPHEIETILKHSEAQVIFSETDASHFGIKNFIWAELEKHLSEKDFNPTPLGDEETATLIYTSGTSGDPKGVCHSIRSIKAAIEIAQKGDLFNRQEVMLSYLPLSHVAERVALEFGALYSESVVYYLDRPEKLPQTLPLVRPTYFFAVPRVWELLKTKIERELDKNDLLKRRLQSVPFFLRNFILGYFIRKKTGFNRLKFAGVGAARVKRESLERLDDWGIRVFEGYGLTETFGVFTFNFKKARKLGSVGKVFPGIEIKFSSEGEIGVKGPHLFHGYYKLDAEAALDPDGFFWTGDLGRRDEEGFIFLLDRKKALIKTSGGKYVAPAPIENLFKEKFPWIKEIIISGEGEPHCVALMMIEEDAFADPGLASKAASQALDLVNKTLGSHEQIKSVGISFKAFAIASGELTPTLKIKRAVVLSKYKKVFDELFRGGERIMLVRPDQSASDAV